MKSHCEVCMECQQYKWQAPPKAPMVETPVVSEPFEKMAIDLVGPYICCGSRYPEAVPLKTIDVREVAEGLLEIFSRTGVPRQLLSDQGSQFIGALMENFTGRLGIEKLVTSPYYPQANGVVRLHKTLNGIIRKAVSRKLDWAEQVKYALYAIRSTPSRMTGYSPYRLVFGREMCTPLDLWISEIVASKSVSKKVDVWLEELEEKLDVVREAARKKQLGTWRASDEYFNRSAKECQLEIGSMVWVRTPGLTGKLDGSWEGPYQVMKCFNKVNYLIDIPGRRQKVVHINNLKEHRQAEAVVR